MALFVEKSIRNEVIVVYSPYRSVINSVNRLYSVALVDRFSCEEFQLGKNTHAATVATGKRKMAARS